MLTILLSFVSGLFRSLFCPWRVVEKMNLEPRMCFRVGRLVFRIGRSADSTKRSVK